MTIAKQRLKTTPAQAHVEREGLYLGKDRGNGPLHYWNVTVISGPMVQPPVRKVYRILCETDYDAAQEALRLFGMDVGDFVTIEV